MTVRDSITRTGARTPGAEDYPTSMAAHGRASHPTQCGITEVASMCARGRHKPNISRCMPGAGLSRSCAGRCCPTCRPSSRIGENPPYGMIGRVEETSASFEARSAPRLYPTERLGVQFPGPTRPTRLCPDVRDDGEYWRVSGPLVSVEALREVSQTARFKRGIKCDAYADPRQSHDPISLSRSSLRDH